MSLITWTPAPTLLGLGLRGWLRLGLIGCAGALLVLNWNLRRAPAETGRDGPQAPPEVVAVDSVPGGPPAPAAETDGPALVNDGWYVRNMATAHGAFVIEVEAEDPDETEAISRALVEPVKDDYAEILVYVNRLGDDSDLPARRVQWTPRDGYVELTYDRPEPRP